MALTGLWIIAGILLFFFLVLLLPVSVVLRFDGAFFLTVRLAFFPVFRLDKTKKPDVKPKREPPEKKKEKPKESRNFFRQLKEKKGFSGAVSALFDLAKRIITKGKRLFRHITLDRLEFFLHVGTGDAAQTAVQYGEICAAAYPVFGLLDTAPQVRFRQIDIAADFTSDTIRFFASGVIRSRVIFLLAFAVRMMKEFLTFRKQVQNDE